MYIRGIDFLKENGYRQYEISNFAKGDFESLHNKTYWHYEDFIGIGPGASGKKGNIRYTNTSSLKEYLSGERKKEIVNLGKEDIYFEALMMGLRLNEGISLKDYKERFGIDLIDYYEEAVKENIEKDYLIIEDGFLKASDSGRPVLHVYPDFLYGIIYKTDNIRV